MQTADQTLLAEGENPSSSELSLMPRADAVAVWKPFEVQIAAFRAEALALKVTDARDTLGMSIAATHRKTAAKIRVAAEKLKVERKKFYLEEGNKVQAGYNAIEKLCKEVEEHCAAQEQFAIREAARIEEENRVARMELIRPFLPPEGIGFDIGKMSEPEFQDYFTFRKASVANAEAEKERYRQEQEAKEAARVAEQERIRLENEHLKAEAEQQARAAAAENARRIELHRRRVSELRPFMDDPEGPDWSRLSDDDFAGVLTRAKEAHAKRKAEREAEEKERQRVTEERLAATKARVEAEEAARKAKADADAREQSARDDERRKAEEAARIERERVAKENAVKAAAAEKVRKEAAQRAAVAERARKESEAKAARLEAEQRAAADAEKERQRQAEAEKRRADAAPDVEKIKAYAQAILDVPFPALSDAATAVSIDLSQRRSQFALWVSEQAARLQ